MNHELDMAGSYYPGTPTGHTPERISAVHCDTEYVWGQGLGIQRAVHRVHTWGEGGRLGQGVM